eukprot:TRINITY_DN89078_c0_g1_i1.p1 TRINITY_DN89078_c0_g1~~TRINITY_DN89078_c0_g1_i1.p1  ORF type:complete len:210 (+),score=50.85 TRINITY_DN89078_c0_g1_i1:86-715(+)
MPKFLHTFASSEFGEFQEDSMPMDFDAFSAGGLRIPHMKKTNLDAIGSSFLSNIKLGHQPVHADSFNLMKMLKGGVEKLTAEQAWQKCTDDDDCRDALSKHPDATAINEKWTESTDAESKIAEHEKKIEDVTSEEQQAIGELREKSEEAWKAAQDEFKKAFLRPSDGGKFTFKNGAPCARTKMRGTYCTDVSEDGTKEHKCEKGLCVAK